MINLIQELKKSIFIYKILGITYNQLKLYFSLTTLISIIGVILKFNSACVTCFFGFNCLLFVGMNWYKNHKYQSLEYKMSILMPILNSTEFAEYQKTLLNQEEENN